MSKKRWLLLVLLFAALAAFTVAVTVKWERDVPVTVTAEPEREVSSDTAPDMQEADASPVFGLSAVDLSGGCVVDTEGEGTYFIRDGLLILRSGKTDVGLTDARMFNCRGGEAYCLGASGNYIYRYDLETCATEQLGLLSDRVIQASVGGQTLSMYETTLRRMLVVGDRLVLLTAEYTGEGKSPFLHTLSVYDLADGCRRVYSLTKSDPASMTVCGGALYLGLLEDKALLRLDVQTLEETKIKLSFPPAIVGADDLGRVVFFDDTGKTGGVYAYDTSSDRWDRLCTPVDGSSLTGRLLLLPDGSLLEQVSAMVDGEEKTLLYRTDAAGHTQCVGQFKNTLDFSHCGFVDGALFFPEENRTVPFQ